MAFLFQTSNPAAEPAARDSARSGLHACVRCLLLVMLVGVPLSPVAISAEGYRPIRRDQFSSPLAQPADELDDQANRPRNDPPARRYAPYQKNSPGRRPAATSPRNPFDIPRSEAADDQDAPEAAPVEVHDSKWEEAPAHRPRRTSPPSTRAEPTDPDSDADGDDRASLVPDDGGPIAELLLQYAVNSEGELGAAYHDLFQHLGPHVRLQVCCPNDASVEAFSNRWGAAASANGRQVQVVNVNRPITVWARDRRICRQTPDGRPAPCFVPTAHFTYDPEKQNDLVLPSLLWPTGLVPKVELNSFHLEGGNVVSNRRHVFVGANAYDDNQHRFTSEKAMFAELSKIFGRPAVAIQGRDGETPWIHTDMYITPIDSRTILVSSPSEGCRLLHGQTTITVAQRDRHAQVEFDDIAADSARQKRFDDVANQLTGMGYQVIRMPSLINVEKDWMVTYNNVLMDYQNGRRVVFMPVYHLPELDHAAAQIYRALGFEVRPVDVAPIFQLGGAIRCLANVTRRLPYESRLQVRATEEPGRLQVYSVDPHANRVKEARPRRERPLPSSLRERPQASLQQPVNAAQ